MGGRDKGLLPWQGRPMAQWVFEALAAVVGPVLISANRSLAEYRKLAPTLVCQDAESIKGHGPLAGLLSGMNAAAGLGAEAVLVSPCDTPEITPEIFAALIGAWRQSPERPVVAHSAGWTHPLHGIYPVAFAPLLEQQLADGNRRVMVFAEAAGVVRLDCDQAAPAFRNRNRPEDLTAAN